MAALRRRGLAVSAAQGRPGLHRPGLPRARRRPSRPQPRPVPGRASTGSPRCWPTGPHPGRRGRRRHRGRDGPVRRGVGTGGFASTAHVAGLLRGAGGARRRLRRDGPLVGRARPRLLAVLGPAIRVAGVILNQVGSTRHEAEARDGVAETGVPVLGVIPRRPTSWRRPPPRPGPGRRAASGGHRSGGRRWPGWSTEHVDLDAVLALARRAPDLAVTAVGPGRGARQPRRSPAPSPGGGRRRRGVHASATPRPSELLAAAGAEVVPFDPLHDAAAAGTPSGLVIGGGFPEVHAAELAANAGMRRSVARARRRRRRRSPPSAPGCSTSARSSTGSPCAASCR